MRRRGWEVRSRTNYILGTDCRLLQNVAVRDARHNTDHYLVLDCLHEAAPTVHSCHLRKRTCFPIKPPTTLDRVNRLFAELWEDISKPPRQERLLQVWISPETWCLINTRIVECWNG